MIGIEVNYKGLAAVIAYQHRRNVWQGTAPYGRAARQSFHDALDHWHQKILPRRFHRGSQGRYRLQPRKKPYKKIKRRLGKGFPSRGRGGDLIRGRDAVVIKGGIVDLVRSGQTERSATRGISTIVAGPKQGVLTINVPFYITQRSRSGKPKMSDEIKEHTSEDIREVSDVAGKSFFRSLKEEARRARARKFRVPAKR